MKTLFEKYKEDAGVYEAVMASSPFPVHVADIIRKQIKTSYLHSINCMIGHHLREAITLEKTQTSKALRIMLIESQNNINYLNEQHNLIENYEK